MAAVICFETFGNLNCRLDHNLERLSDIFKVCKR